MSHGETDLTVSYWPPNLEDDILVHSMFRAIFQSFGIRDGAGNFAARFSDRAVENRTAALVTAHFENVPVSHDGSTTFAFEFHFGDEIEELSYRTVRDAFFDVSGGRVTKAGRLTRGKNQKWKVTVEPTSTADIVITTRGTESCDATHAVCTADGRIYAGGDSITVARYALSVADADVREGPDATLDFVVTLSRERTEATTVDYATSDGTATAGTDYTAASGTLTFVAGETSKTVSVAVLDDTHDEGGGSRRCP